MRFADLHLHTFHSDGTRSTREVLELAARHDLAIIAISDHDNLAAVDEALSIAPSMSIHVIPAVELSTDFQGVDVHLLAYGFDHHNRELERRLEQFRKTRRERGAQMVQKLLEHGCAIEEGRVLEICGTASLGRPHIARALVEAGVVGSIEQAFDQWLSPGCPAYVEKERFPAEEAIDLVHRLGGLASVAHPTLYPNWAGLTVELFDRGADAVEALHPEVDATARQRLQELARIHGKFVTGGSDDHGFEDLRTIGTIRVPEELIKPLFERSRSFS